MEEGMERIPGKYQHERNENLDEYFKALGVPYIARKMMLVSHPRIEIWKENDKWIIKTVTMIRTQQVTFHLGEQYEEVMPTGVKIQCVTTWENNGLVTVSKTDDGNTVTRRYDFTDDDLVLTMSQEKSDQVAKRYFKKTEVIDTYVPG